MEANRRLISYVSAVVEAVSTQNGHTLRDLLSITSNSPHRESVTSALDVIKDPTRITKQAGQFGDMLLHHMRCMQWFTHRNFVDCYNALEKSANSFLQEFRNWETAWAMDALYTMVYELRTLAEMADRELAGLGRVPDKLKGAGSFLMKVFGALAGKGPKRVGALYVTCQLFKVYFKLGTVHLCRSVIRSIETARVFDFEEFPTRDKLGTVHLCRSVIRSIETARVFDFEEFPTRDKLGTVHLCRSVIRSIETARVFDFEEFPTRDKVTYNYYTGRLEVFNDNFQTAEQKLMYALVHCEASKVENVRMILKYLVPVKLSLGILPKQSLLQKYNLAQYVDIVQALRMGDIRLLHRALDNYEDEFLRSGVYLVLEKLELQVYQRLIKKIYIIQKQKDPVKAHQVKMEVVVKALKWLEIDTDIDEVECIMAILIHKNLMKGYFSHKSKVVVLSKQEPFPKLSGRPVNS